MLRISRLSSQRLLHIKPSSFQPSSCKNPSPCITSTHIRQNFLFSSVNSFNRSQDSRDPQNGLLQFMKHNIRLLHTKPASNSLIDKFAGRIQKLKCPEPVRQALKLELEKFSRLDVSNHEYTVTRGYLDHVTSLPWESYSKDNLSIEHAENILNEDHYGLEDVKERIIEFIAVAARKNEIKGKILCLVGPPGVGKTSIGKSIARALNKEYYRFSLGGISDYTEIKGHRRTYVGAMPGKLLSLLRNKKTSNPLIMLDEIDKLGKGSHHGDPAAALLEVLDPEHNSSFQDHYTDVPYDLSKALFVATANTTETIPAPLLDRMEVIRLPSYLTSEKIEIAKRHIIPQVMKDTNIKEGQLKIDTDALQILTKRTKEGGVRKLKQNIEKIFQKFALNLVTNKVTSSIVTKDNLNEYLPDFQKSDKLIYGNETPVGVALGLAASENGGSTLYIEAVPSYSQSSNRLNCTGNLGESILASSRIAFSYAYSYLEKSDPSNQFFHKNKIHLHIPEGSTPKDGPSAGCTITTAFLSLAMNKRVKPQLGMTGEISLHGKILPVGGIREKLVAGKESGAKTLIFPKANYRDYERLPEYVKEGMEVVFVSNYEQIFAIAFVEEEARIQTQSHHSKPVPLPLSSQPPLHMHANESFWNYDQKENS